MAKDIKVMTGVREYNEGHDVKLMRCNTDINDPEMRLCVVAVTEGGWSATRVDLLDLIAWIKTNHPELLS